MTFFGRNAGRRALCDWGITFGVEHWTQKVRRLYANLRNTTLLPDLRRVAYVYVDDLALGSVLLCRHGVQ